MTGTPAVATAGVAGTSRAVLAAVGKGLLNAAITVGIVLAAWQALIMSGKISPYVAKGPLDVWRFLFVTDPDARATAGERRELLFDLAAVSLKAGPFEMWWRPISKLSCGPVEISNSVKT